ASAKPQADPTVNGLDTVVMRVWVRVTGRVRPCSYGCYRKPGALADAFHRRKDELSRGRPSRFASARPTRFRRRHSGAGSASSSFHQGAERTTPFAARRIRFEPSEGKILRDLMDKG